MTTRDAFLSVCACLSVACSSDSPLDLPSAPPDLSADLAPIPTAEIAVKQMGTGKGIISSMPPGISCGQNCSALFPVGQLVKIIAQPDFQSSFDGFTGACKGKICELLPDSTEPLDVYTSFKKLPLQVNLWANLGSGSLPMV